MIHVNHNTNGGTGSYFPGVKGKTKGGLTAEQRLKQNDSVSIYRKFRIYSQKCRKWDFLVWIWEPSTVLFRLIVQKSFIPHLKELKIDFSESANFSLKLFLLKRGSNRDFSRKSQAECAVRISMRFQDFSQDLQKKKLLMLGDCKKLLILFSSSAHFVDAWVQNSF